MTGRLEHATARLDALLAIPTNRPHDERAESIEHLQGELSAILAVLRGDDQ